MWLYIPCLPLLGYSLAPSASPIVAFLPIRKHRRPSPPLHPPTQHWTFLLLDSSPLHICKAKPPAFCGLYSVAISSRKLATGSLFKIAISPSIRVCPMPFPCSSFFLFNTSFCTVFIMNLFITVLNTWLLQLESAVEAGVLVGVCLFPDFVCS